MKMRAVIFGHESLALQCAKKWCAAGHDISAVVTRHEGFASWARQEQIEVVEGGPDLAMRLEPFAHDWMLSISNLDILPASILQLPKRGAVNFHDGPLPKYAGLNAPIWAKIDGETQHGISWHLISDGIDNGDVLLQRGFEIADHDTGLTLNTKAYEAALGSFEELIQLLAKPETRGQAQDLSQRSYFGKFKRPAAFGLLDLTKKAAEVISLVRALDHGDYFNPLCLPKIKHAGHVFVVRNAELAPNAAESEPPGTIVIVSEEAISVRVADMCVAFSGLQRLDEKQFQTSATFQVGDCIAPLEADAISSLNSIQTECARCEDFWREMLRRFQPFRISEAGAPTSAPTYFEQPMLNSPKSFEERAKRTSALIAALSENGVSDVVVQLETPAVACGLVNDWLPLRTSGDVEAKLKQFAQMPAITADLQLRDPNIARFSMPDIGIADGDSPIDGCAITVTAGAVIFDTQRLSASAIALWSIRFEHLFGMKTLPDANDTFALLPDAELEQVTDLWNSTQSQFESGMCVHELVAVQAKKTPQAVALVFEDKELTYQELEVAAEKGAARLQALNVKRGEFVGLCVERSPLLVIGALAIWKAGAAYVPIDPTYPEDRKSLYIEDSGLSVVLSQSSLVGSELTSQAQFVALDELLSDEGEKVTVKPTNVGSDDLAYLIYTSGSTGRPKGVMVEHRNVSNFFTGMDARIERSSGDVWLAVTSLSFDISVLELFYSLSRGIKLVISGDESNLLASEGPLSFSSAGMEFGLFYWGNDDGPGKEKYRLLLEGAKFADANGFSSVWTPERHFHAFGGPYPNPSVTGAAVAAVTERIAVRSGSCVAPLHHPLRIAEEWAVIDNLTEGRAGLAIASGWQPDDFVLRPENAPPANKPAMSQAIEQLRKLWRGEPIGFDNGAGKIVEVLTQPRPVSKELPIWVTTAGNPETWKEAGAIGANVLTHLLGQSIDEVAEKIEIYRSALASAGHDPEKFTVTLMLHTYVADTREKARETARQPMKDYLNAAAGLIKQYAWAFPAFKRPKGVNNPFEMDLDGLEPEELDAILDFAFDRYFEDSGLFGTVEDCLSRVEQLKQIGVNEIGCLIDYGIDPNVVLDGLKPLAEVLRQSNHAEQASASDFSLAAQILRHKVTHLQCTPSLMRLILADDASKQALAEIRNLYIGGEALPGALLSEIHNATSAKVHNMYGPTETTIWSTTETPKCLEDTVNIGKPISNTQVFICNDEMKLCPVGVLGELLIGGAGVTRGYWKRKDLTTERFITNPFGEGRLYKTGDLVRWRSDGKLDYVGRADGQVKLRGYRLELGEIEARLHELPDVVQAVVMTRELAEGDTRLVAYLNCKGRVDPQELRKTLSKNLPEFMIPQHFMNVEKFPLTPNNKVDRNKLPLPQVAVPSPNLQSEEPISLLGDTSDDVHASIADIWRRTLGIDNISGNDSFFELGGHSLLAVQAHREIRDACHVPKLSITDIFRFPKLTDLSARVSELGARVHGADTAHKQRDDTPMTNVVDGTMSRRRQMRARRELARQS